MMDYLYLTIIFLLCTSCGLRHTGRAETFPYKFIETKHSHLRDSCLLNYGLLPLMKIDTVQFIIQESSGSIIVNIDEHNQREIDKINDYSKGKDLEFYINIDCLMEKSPLEVLTRFQMETNHHILNDGFQPLDSYKLHFELNVNRRAKFGIYPTPKGGYIMKFDEGKLIEATRFYVVYES